MPIFWAYCISIWAFLSFLWAFCFDRVIDGGADSHIKLKKKFNGKIFIVIVPDHPELAIGTLKSILRQANITKEDFLKLL
jgi:predicted RNA binding protein YcfA (HicA-like mRNA interferase family)